MGLELNYKKNLSIDLVDKVFADLGIPNIFCKDNKAISFDLVLDNHVAFALKNNNCHIPIFFELNLLGIRMDVGDTEETFFWPIDDIRSDQEIIQKMIFNLLTSTVMIERFFLLGVKLHFFNSKGKRWKHLYFIKPFGKTSRLNDYSLYCPVNQIDKPTSPR